MKKIAFLTAVALASIAITGSAAANDTPAVTPGEVFYDEGSATHHPNTPGVVVASVSLPAAGSYLIHADTDFYRRDRYTEESGARCDILLPNEFNSNGGMQVASHGPNGYGTVSFTVALTTTQPGPVNLRCYQISSGGPTLFFNHGRITAQAVPKITRF
ncbi:hypothetical protein ACIBG7_26925 [Nonomuraea sp. NPDC050328]|uniref:hypothetical protein n=1 Tax=Nonomuraea sp. NPDC050328 TaxID=3364361 RepID=UPI00378938CB